MQNSKNAFLFIKKQNEHKDLIVVKKIVFYFICFCFKRHLKVENFDELNTNFNEFNANLSGFNADLSAIIGKIDFVKKNGFYDFCGFEFLIK
jgi:hypothetical protein